MAVKSCPHRSCSVPAVRDRLAKNDISRSLIDCPVPELAAKYALHDSRAVAFNEPAALAAIHAWIADGLTVRSMKDTIAPKEVCQGSLVLDLRRRAVHQ